MAPESTWSWASFAIASAPILELYRAARVPKPKSIILPARPFDSRTENYEIISQARRLWLFEQLSSDKPAEDWSVFLLVANGLKPSTRIWRGMAGTIFVIEIKEENLNFSLAEVCYSTSYTKPKTRTKKDKKDWKRKNSKTWKATTSPTRS